VDVLPHLRDRLSLRSDIVDGGDTEPVLARGAAKADSQEGKMIKDTPSVDDSSAIVMASSSQRAGTSYVHKSN